MATLMAHDPNAAARQERNAGPSQRKSGVALWMGKKRGPVKNRQEKGWQPEKGGTMAGRGRKEQAEDLEGGHIALRLLRLNKRVAGGLPFGT